MIALALLMIELTSISGGFRPTASMDTIETTSPWPGVTIGHFGHSAQQALYMQHLALASHDQRGLRQRLPDPPLKATIVTKEARFKFQTAITLSSMHVYTIQSALYRLR